MVYEFKSNKTEKILTIGADNYMSACNKLLDIHNKNNNTNCCLHDINKDYTSL